MATLILRPSSDVSLNHSLSQGSNGYSLINETSADDDSTYIYQSISSTSSKTVTSSFNIRATLPSGLFRINSIILCVRAKSSSSSGSYSGTYKLSTDSSSSSMSLSTSYSDNTKSAGSSLVGNVYNSSNFPSLSVEVSTTGRLSSSKGNSYELRITQIYISIDYTTVYTYTANAIGDSGVSSISPNNLTVYSDESSCSFSATLLNNYEFVGWYSDSNYSNLVSTSNPYNVNLTGDLTLYAKTLYKIIPVITVYTPSKSVISDESGYTECTCEFSSDVDLISWEARATKSGITPSRGVGLLVEEGSSLSSGSKATVSVLYTELTEGDGDYVITVYGRSTSGHWSDGSYESI